MLLNEFAAKCGLTSAEAEEEYVLANAIYESLPDEVANDNTRFCELYTAARKKPAALTLLQGLHDTIARRDREIASLNAEIKILGQNADIAAVTADQVRDEMEREHAAHIAAIGEQIAGWHDTLSDPCCAPTEHKDTMTEMRTAAVTYMGSEGKYLAWKLEQGNDLTGEECRRIANLLRNHQ